MQLRSLLESAGIDPGPSNPEIGGLCIDSRSAKPGDLFIALPGARHDGAKFVQEAVGNGAAAVLSETEIPGLDVPLRRVSDSRRSTADLATIFHGNPSADLKCVGITGTNGKTTTAFLAHHIFNASGIRSGLLGTVRYVVAGSVFPATHTTPEAPEIQRLLALMRDSGEKAAVLEVSSHSIVQHRVRGLEFDAAVFTNLTQDHLDYHGTMDAYFSAKAGLFEALASQTRKHGRAVINSDDRYGQRLIDSFSKKLKIITYGRNVHAEFRASSIQQSQTGTQFTLEARGKSYLIRSPLIGLFNVYNALAALAACVTCGVDLRRAVDALAGAPQVPGRMERVPSRRNFQVFVDYAHTDDALRNALSALRELKPARLLTVFGCGGDRDATKRPLMAAAAEELSDFVLLTSDNPRSENPAKIIADAKRGLRLGNHEIIEDRALAIRRAVELAAPGDIVLVAGKGHEKTQILAGETVPFDDVAVAARAISEKKVGG